VEPEPAEPEVASTELQVVGDVAVAIELMWEEDILQWGHVNLEDMIFQENLLEVNVVLYLLGLTTMLGLSTVWN
jgi:hypothetical protein